MNQSEPNKKNNLSFDIYHDLFVKASMQGVFNAITKPEHLMNWWPLRCSGTPELEAVYNFYFSPDYDWYGKVVHVQANQSFYIKMVESDSDWNQTTLGFELKPIGTGVQLCFSHEGWPACNHHFRRSSWCWAILLKGLKEYVEFGKIVPFSDRE